jgi:aminopeptidase N
LNAFTARNPLHFHRIDGQGYRFIADQIIDLDARNPSVSAKLASCFNSWKRYEPKRRVLMQAELDRLASKKLSPGTYEIVTKALI